MFSLPFSFTFSLLTALSAFTLAVCGPVPGRPGFRIGDVVDTTSGTIQGKASELRPDVSEYLGIPFAEPPTENLRFAAPVPFTRSETTIDATTFSPDCPCNRIPKDQAPLAGPAGSKILLALAQDGRPQSEDCLTLNIWTKPQTGETKKAVLFWIFGGAFNIGNSASPIYDGAVLADENDVIVVSVNYRLNIFGFSGAPGADSNVGLRDQRLALEWTRDNIEAFGGDPDRITVFGQSAGGASADYMTYAYKDDPIAHAFIAHSGVANSVISTAVPASVVQSKWFAVSNTLGCGGSDAGEAALACVRSKSMDDVLRTMGEQFLSNSLATGFLPVIDGETLPSNPPSQGSAGDFARVPFMTGSTNGEAGLLILAGLAYSSITPEQEALIPFGILQPVLNLFTQIAFGCPAAAAASYRYQHGVPVWRYRYYGGNYSNTYVNYIGSAYHTSELPTVFGTAASVSGMPDSDVEGQAGAYMRSAWAAFAKDPKNGLLALGWPQYNPLTRSQARLSYEDETSASFISNAETDNVCPLINGVLSLVPTLLSFLSNIGELISGGGSQQERELWGALHDIAEKDLNPIQAMLAFKDVLESIIL